MRNAEKLREIEFTLKSASEMMRNHFQDIVEMDETYFRSTKKRAKKSEGENTTQTRDKEGTSLCIRYKRPRQSDFF